jgi:periplasmic protein TonB
MLNVLLESNATRQRQFSGTVASAMVHAGLIVAAVAVTVPVAAHERSEPNEPIIPYVVPRPAEPAAPQPAHTAQASAPTESPIPRPTIEFAEPKGPVITDVTPTVIPTGATEIGPGLPVTGLPGSPIGASGPPAGIVDEHLVDRAPRMLGRAEPPVFPSALRASGRSGRVVVQFVIDTLGRAEMAEFRPIESTDPLFVESVRAALPRYRFSPGEAGGRKVRTLVQLPFDFTLVR